MNEEVFRRPSKSELGLLNRLLEANFPGRDEVAQMIDELQVRYIDNEGSLELRSLSRTIAHVVKQVPVEAQAKDEDGYDIHVLLHVVDGRPTELEIFKDDGSVVVRMPEPASFQLVVLPPSPDCGL